MTLEDTATPKTPIHLWIVGAICTLWSIVGCLDFTMTAIRHEGYLSNFPPDMIAYIFNSPWWQWAAWTIGVWGGLIGSVALLLRSRIAFPALAVSALGATVSMANGYFDPSAPKVEGMEFMPLIILGIAYFLVAYALWLTRRGILR